jgi:hypothetical protein
MKMRWWMRNGIAGLVALLVVLNSRANESGVTVPSAVRPVAMAPKALPSLPHSFAAGLWECEPQVVLEALDLQTLAMEDAEAVAAGEKALRIGVVRKLPDRIMARGSAAPASHGGWSVLADGSRVWCTTLRSDGARGIRVHFEDVELPDGCEIRVFDTEDPMVMRGPYGSANVRDRKTFWSGALFAQTVTVECWVPQGVDPARAAFSIGKVVHFYRAPGMVTLREGNCHNDVSCYPEWGTASRGVAGIGVFYAENYLYCTGCLLNDLDDSTWIDFFLTGTHCVANQSEANDAEFYWFFQTATCNGAPPPLAAVTVTEGGADYLAGQTYEEGNDFALLRLRSPSPDGATYVGWSTDKPSYTETLTCIHHPGGAYKRISFGRLDEIDPYYWFVNFTDGATEPGSSGAPLFDETGRLIGQLVGGSSSCEAGGGIDAFGRFDVTYEDIKGWLTGENEIPQQPELREPIGTYPGVAFRDKRFGGGDPLPDVCGTFSMNVTRRGRISAKVVLQGRSLRFKAPGWQGVTEDGDYYVRMQSSGGEVLELWVNWITALGRLSGGSLGNEEIFIEAAYHVFADRADNYAQADLAQLRGYYTVSLFPYGILSRGAAQEEPQGSGYLTMTVGLGGRVRIAGVLAEGTKVSQASTLLLFGEYGDMASVPFFRPLYRRLGGIGAMLWIAPNSRVVDTDWSKDWYVRWDKPGSGPDGFEALLVPCGGYFGKGAALPVAEYWLCAQTNDVAYYLSSGAVLPQYEALPYGVPVTSTGTRLVIEEGVRPVKDGDGNYVYTGANSALATLSYSPMTGIYKGRFKQYYDYDSGRRLVHKSVGAPFAGVMTQVRHSDFDEMPDGMGYYLLTETNPELRALRIKRSFWIDLVAVP